MDLAIEYLDNLYLDEWYSKNAPVAFQDRDYWLRQFSTIMLLWTIGGWLMYVKFVSIFRSFCDHFSENSKDHIFESIQKCLLYAINS
jgi:hypothetical protein